MTTSIEIRELPARLNELLARVSAGDEIVLLDGATRCARIVPFPAPGARIPGLHPRALVPAADFDAALSDDFWSGQP